MPLAVVATGILAGADLLRAVDVSAPTRRYSGGMSTSRKRYTGLKRRWRAAVGPVRSRAGVQSESEVIVDHIDEHLEDLYRRVEELETTAGTEG